MVGDVKGSFGFCLLKQGWFHCFALNVDLVSLLKKKLYNIIAAQPMLKNGRQSFRH